MKKVLVLFFAVMMLSLTSCEELFEGLKCEKKFEKNLSIWLNVDVKYADVQYPTAHNGTRVTYKGEKLYCNGKVSNPIVGSCITIEGVASSGYMGFKFYNKYDKVRVTASVNDKYGREYTQSKTFTYNELFGSGDDNVSLVYKGLNFTIKY